MIGFDPLCLNCGHRYSLHTADFHCIQNPGGTPEVVLPTTFLRDSPLEEAPVIDLAEGDVGG